MVHVGRHPVRSRIAADPRGRRSPVSWAAALPAVAGTVVLASLLAAGLSPTRSYAPAPAPTPAASAVGVAEPPVAPSPTGDAATPRPDDRAPAPIPGPIVPDSSTPGRKPDGRLDPGHDRAHTDAGGTQSVHPPGFPGLPPDDLRLGFDPANPALSGPAAGSHPSVSPSPIAPPGAPAAPPANPVAEQRSDRWEFLHSSATGEWLFLTGFLLLLLSIGGLVTVGWYRRRW